MTETGANNGAAPLRVLLVDDDRDDYVLTRGMLSKVRGGTTRLEWASSYEAALEALARGEHDVALVDYRLGERSGVDLVVEAVRRGCRAPLILLTGQGDHEIDMEAMRAGAADFLLKSDLTPALLERSIRYAIERRRTEDELERSLSVLRATLESTADGILVIDVHGRVAGYNRKFAEMWGVPLHLLEARDDVPVLAMVTAQLEDPPAFLSKVRQLYADPQATSFDVLRLKDGRIFERYSQPQIIGGQSVGRVWSFRDVSERERGAEALQHSEALKAAILETALDCIITMDSEGRVVEWNPAAEKTFGYARTEVLGQLMDDLIVPPTFRAIHARGLQNYLATGVAKMLGRRVEMPAVRADGSDLMVEMSVVQIPVEGQRGPLFTAYLRDITERKLAETELATRARYETGLAACSQTLLTISEPRQAIHQALEHLLHASQVSRVYIFENFDDARDGLCMRQTHEVCAPGVPPEIDNLELQHLPYQGDFRRWRDELSSGRAINSMADEFSDDERAILEAQGIQSILVLPIWAGGHWHGFVGFDDVWQKHPWNEANTQLLRAAANAIGAYLERRQVEEAVRRRAEFEALIASISTSFINLASNQVDEGIERALQSVGEFSDVDRCYVFQVSEDGRSLSNTHEWCARGIEPQIERLQELPTAAFLWVMARLRAFETVHVPRVADLPEAARAEREEFQVEGIQSIVLVPMVYRGQLVGHLGFDAVRGEKTWSEQDIGLLRIAGEMVVNAIERKRAEELLRGSEARNRALLNAIPDLITRVHRDGTFLDVIPTQNFDPRLAPEAIVGRNLREVFDPEIAERALVCMERALRTRAVESLEYQLEQGGEIAFFEARMVASGEHEVTTIVRDVSARQHAEAEILRLNEGLEQRVEERTLELADTNFQLQQERRRLADTLSNVPGVVFETWFQPDAAAGRINFVSDYLTTMLGYSVDEWLSVPNFWLSKVHSDDREQIERSMALKFEGIEAETRAYRMFAKDGRLVWNESQMRVVRDSNGTPAGLRGVSMDITERKRAEEELRAAKDEADRANRAKSEFLSRMSHELRTPLNAILGFAQLLQMNPLDAKQTQSVGHILKGGRHLLSLINEVLDIARIEAGNMSLSLEPVAVGAALQEVLDQIRPLAAARDIELHNEALGCEWHVGADKQRLKQVLLNLLSNAVKYNREGGTVTLSCQPMAQGQLRLQVRDTGPGLRAEDAAKLFVPFERLGAAQSSIEGTGIGLALSKRLVEAMEGQIGVESTVGQGSTFWVELPTVAAPAQVLQGLEPAEAPTLDENGVQHTLLYIEDNLANVVLLEELVKMQPGLRLLPAMQGSMGLELARQHCPDLILLDLHLPDMNGDEVLRHLRGDIRTREIPVVVVSADATQQQIQRLLEGGAQEYLTKPLDVREFFRVLNAILIQGSAPQPALPPLS